MTGMTGNLVAFCCVGVTCDLPADATAEDGVVGCVDIASDTVSDFTVVGVATGKGGELWIFSITA